MGRPAIDRERVFSAARQAFLTRGVGLTTYDQIAAAAGVSRATVYRSVGARSDLVRGLLVEEAAVLFANVDRAMAGATSAADLVALGVEAALTTIRDRPLLRRLAGPDLPIVLPVLTTDGHGLIQAAVDALLPLLERAATAGLVEDDELDRIAEDLVRYVIALVHTPALRDDARRPGIGSARAAALFGPALARTPVHDYFQYSSRNGRL